VIEVHGLWAGYGELDILRDFEIRVDAGTTHCIVGPNGAGKSTVLKTLSGLLKPRQGSIVVDGVDITGKSPTVVLQAGIAQVPQRNGLFAGLTVEDNVLMGAYVARRNRRALRNRYEQLCETFPILSARAHVPAGALSGGQRRMVEFARVMILEPRVVLLDEPTLGLDPKSLSLISDSVTALQDEGVTILMVEQNVRLGLRLSDHATVMSAGSVALAGTADEIRDHPELMSLFFGHAPAPHHEGEELGSMASPLGCPAELQHGSG